MGHASVEFALQEEGDNEPVDADHTVGGAFQEEECQSADNCDRRFEAEVQIFKQIEDKPQVNVLELVDFGLREAIRALLGHLQ